MWEAVDFPHIYTHTVGIRCSPVAQCDVASIKGFYLKLFTSVSLFSSFGSGPVGKVVQWKMFSGTATVQTEVI